MLNQTENSHSPRVTVVIASYNHKRYVRKAITSVLKQSATDIEVIVVDDGSSDGTPEVVASIGDPRLALIRLDENRVRHPRNIGIEKAKGQYIAFQNSDDLWDPGKLEAQIKYLDTHDDCVACFTGVEIINKSGRIAVNSWADGIFTNENRSSSAWLRRFFFEGNCLCLPSAMVRRDALVRVGGLRPCLVQNSDFDLWIRLATHGEFYILEERFTKMRIIEGQNLSQPSPANESLSRVEHSEILNRYLAPEIMDRFDQIFPEWSDLQTAAARKGAMALHHAGAMNGYKIFADRTLAAILDDPSGRADAMKAHGNDLNRRFLENRVAILSAPIILPPPKKRVSIFKKLSRMLRGKYSP